MVYHTAKNVYKKSIPLHTNADGYNWTGGLQGWTETKYARAIGNGKQKVAVEGDDGKGALVAEWGFIDSSYYTSSDFEKNNLIIGPYDYSLSAWAVDSFYDTEPHKYIVYWSTGFISYIETSTNGIRAACVTP